MLAWVYLLDVAVRVVSVLSGVPPFSVQALGEPTSLLASLGTAVVFGSAVAAARIDARGRTAPLPLK